MITNQYLNRITAVLMAVAVVITGTVWVWTQSDGFVSTGTHFDYEGSLFGENTVATIDIQVDKLAEGIRKFAIDQEKLEKMIGDLL